jgi:type VI secretion system secreted protein VgrG
MLDIAKTLAHLKAHAGLKSVGKCAKAVADAIEAGGVKIERKPSAKDYGSNLAKIGFCQIDKQNYTPKAGDICVLTHPQSPHGHIAMYEGQNWLSDFIQRDMFGGKLYRTSETSFKIWRYKS